MSPVSVSSPDVIAESSIAQRVIYVTHLININ
jgi:hypothetical protein